jgi:hypothetical protein
MCVEVTTSTILISLIFEGHLENRTLAPLKKKHDQVLCMIKPLAIGFIKIGLVLGIALSMPFF